ncbi:hypothetical protein [Psychromonas aquimarina]|uniref:hypothetical protein n=1 Tax=Psychromonas aquimarina TaxID=444919 RepID=UPI00048B97BE|nr:hypothetical protein [Psychromonas aquimarina]
MDTQQGIQLELFRPQVSAEEILSWSDKKNSKRRYRKRNTLDTQQGMQLELLIPLVPVEKKVLVVEEKVVWSDNDISELRYGMLLTAVQEIRDLRKSTAMREEAWNWLFSDVIAPFSAQVCAECSGYDIEELRRLLGRLFHV